MKIKSLEVRTLNAHMRLAMLALDEFSAAADIHTRREAEKKGTLYLLEKLFPEETPVLKYMPNGKPYVEGAQGGISISHSHNLLAVLSDSQNAHTGLDVELIRDKVLKIRHKFLSAAEQKFIPPDNIIMHIMAWCVKETLYKIHPEGKIEFTKHLSIEPFAENDHELKGACTSTGHTFSKTLKIERPDGYIISWPLN